MAAGSRSPTPSPLMQANMRSLTKYASRPLILRALTPGSLSNSASICSLRFGLVMESDKLSHGFHRRPELARAERRAGGIQAVLRALARRPARAALRRHAGDPGAARGGLARRSAGADRRGDARAGQGRRGDRG